MTITDNAEQYTWWRARWSGGSWSPPETAFYRTGDNAERAARDYVAGLHPGYGAVVECCTVTRTKWKVVDGDA